MLRLKSGTLQFFSPVHGKVTGAVFFGEGYFVLEASSASERRSLSLLTQQGSVQEQFTSAVFRFTDGTYQELKNEGTATPATDLSNAAKLASDNVEMLANNRVMRYNLSARILQDVLSDQPVPGAFYAFFAGKNYGKSQVFVVDPQGADLLGVEPEEVAYATFEESTSTNGPSIWYSGHLANEDGTPAARGTQMNYAIDLQKEHLDVTLEKNGHITAAAVVTFAGTRPGLRVARFNLFRNFEVQGVTDADGQPLDSVMEHRGWDRTIADDPGNFAVILPKPLAVGESFTFKVTYGGKEAVTNEGGDNYYPIARDDWYPAARRGDFAEYEITFRIPKGMTMAATGDLVRESTEGDQQVSEWRSRGPIAMAGFNFGRMKMVENKLSNGFFVRAYANESQPSWVQLLEHVVNRDLPQDLRGGMSPLAALGGMSTLALIKRPLAEGSISTAIYGDYFGKIPFQQLLLTQQTACTYGQAWPGLVWLPICGFYDNTVRHQLGLDDPKEAYWDVVTAHEVAHQWWGQTVGWASYRDQWMSEGFAEFSASLFTEYTNKKQEPFLKFWRDRQRNIQEKNQFGFRYCDVAPLIMGFRINNRKAGSASYRRVIYAKGAFVLHMLRMMMMNETGSDNAFKSMMHDFVHTYQNRPASTEDFQAIVEKYMTPRMNMDGSHNMNWFFREWVYGTDIPHYDFEYEYRELPGKGQVAHIKLVQSGVSQDFRMLVPVYAEMTDGQMIRAGSFRTWGNSTTEIDVPVGNGPLPRRLMINYEFDVLTRP
jgi:hypothetical protein